MGIEYIQNNIIQKIVKLPENKKLLERESSVRSTNNVSQDFASNDFEDGPS